MSVFADLGGSLTAGKFYHDILSRPAKKGWTLYLTLVISVAAILAIYWGVRLNSYAGEVVAFFTELDRPIEFSNGEIINMPQSHKEFYFKDLTIHVDSKYKSESDVNEDTAGVSLPAVFIGPNTAFLFTTDYPQAINYPLSFTDTIDLSYIKKAKKTAVISSIIGGFIAWILIKFIESMVYILIIIAPILLFKFRRMGLTYGEAFKVGLFLISYQIIISTILMLFGLAYFWLPLLIIAFYVFFIGGFVNLDLTHSKRKLFTQESGA